MKLFGKKNNAMGTLYAPVSGECVSINAVRDEAFAGKLCGDGIAIVPTENLFRSPTDGVVTGIAESKHAYAITGRDGAEILVHIGLDTVELRGEGFDPKVAVGENVKRGDVLCQVDLNLLREKGYDTTSPTVITNADELKNLSVHTGEVRGGEAPVIEYTF